MARTKASSEEEVRKRLTRLEGLVLILLAVIFLPPAWTLLFPPQRQSTDDFKRSLAREDIASLGEALEKFKRDCGRYPTAEEGLYALVERPPGCSGWRGPYRKSEPWDPWGRFYEYRITGGRPPYVIVSLGRDGKPGGEGPNADITSSEPPSP